MVEQPLTDAERQLPPHLGGHMGRTNVDTVTLDYLIARYGVKSMLDVGCGPGGMVEAAKQRGIVAFGLDGDFSFESSDIIIFDYTEGPYDPGDPFDLIWCMEFVEHVEAQYQDNYLATFDAGRVLFLTAAYPGQGGHHHVNERPSEYWADLLSQRGWILDKEATAWVRAHGAAPFSRMTGMVFTKA